MDLNAPLGMEPRPPSRRRLVPIAAGGVALIALAGFGFVLATADPHGGEPSAVVALPPVQATKNASSVDATPTGSLAQPASKVPVVANNAPLAAPTGTTAEPFDQGSVENGVRVFRGTEPSSPGQAASHGPLVIDVTRQLDASPHKARGAGPSVATASPSGPPAKAPTPRVAIYIGGMGLSQTATRTATEIMPPDVTLAFVPYGATISASVDAAKAKGHEVLLQLPMQSAQGTAPGPHALRPDETADAVAGDLNWLLTRFNGYDGVTNLLGGPVTANAATMGEVLKAVGARNLFFIDDGTSKRSLAPGLAAQLNVAAAQVDVVLDATSDPAVVRANLESLVAIARRKGQAIGMASGLPDHLATIARFAADLQSKNISLVPVSALARHDANLAAISR